MKIVLRNRGLWIRHFFKERVLTLRDMHFSLKEPAPSRRLLIVMIDGRQYHGGMCDRFKGIISLYAYCKHNGLDFRILYTYPFQLSDYLLPASYDWRLDMSDYSDNMRYSRILYMRGETDASRLVRLKTGRQIHFYGNRDLLPSLNAAWSSSYCWGELFRELFRPVPALADRISVLKQDIGDVYDAVVFRFQNLLGDFHEYKFKALSDEASREILIRKCLDYLKGYFSGSTEKIALLVTSDSSLFLERAAEIAGVHTIPGRIVHIDGLDRSSLDGEGMPSVYMKSFLDFYMLAGARRISCPGTPEMYPSEFPMYAAKVNGIPFKRILLD